MTLWLLLACTCTSPEPPPAEDAPDVAEAAPTSPEEDLPPEVEPEDDESRAKAIDLACTHIEQCGCADQPHETCVTSSTATTLPAHVYRCIRFVSCDKLCDASLSGSPGKGTRECVEPWVKSQVPGGPKAGLKKHRKTTFTPKKREEASE